MPKDKSGINSCWGIKNNASINKVTGEKNLRAVKLHKRYLARALSKNF